jgi:hypothetical protein
VRARYGSSAVTPASLVHPPATTATVGDLS